MEKAPLTIRELKRRIDLLVEGLADYNDPRITVKVSGEGTVGATPTVDVVTLSAGFDWDTGKIILHPTKPLYLKPPKK
jgi:hypothetical protein